MSLVNKLLSANKVVRKSGDEVLLMLGVLLMQTADGAIEPSEMSLLESFVATLPEFRGKELGWLVDQAGKVAQQYPSFRKAVEALTGIESEATKRKCFILAVDMAFASGEIYEVEEQLLEDLQRVLAVPDDLVRQVLEVFAIKYAA
jgi:uncharacterized tellurite resistance protein B-like protein